MSLVIYLEKKNVLSKFQIQYVNKFNIRDFGQIRSMYMNKKVSKIDTSGALCEINY